MKRFKQQSVSPLEDYQEAAAAFADDAVRGAQLGGSIWPPRSYSCSFCKREFRSAQALGGHMNVHRRDRALLKQVITSHNDHLNHHDYNNHNNNNNHNHDYDVDHSGKTSLPDNSNRLMQQVCGPNKTSSVAHHHHHHHHGSSHTRVSSNSVKNGIRKVISSTNDVVPAKLFMGLDLAIGTYREGEEAKNNRQEDFFKCKRSKKNGDDCNNNNINNVALFPCFEGNKSSIKDNKDSNVPKILSHKASKSMEELDLELRLGEPPQKRSSSNNHMFKS